jgi:hypothetical protein
LDARSQLSIIVGHNFFKKDFRITSLVLLEDGKTSCITIEVAVKIGTSSKS